MHGLLVAFGSIWAVTAVGWLIGRLRLLGGNRVADDETVSRSDNAEAVLARLVFFVAAPALLFVTLSRSSPSALATPALGAFVASTLVMASVYVLLARLRWQTPVPETTIGTLGASYVNAANLGIPVAAYALGDVSFAAPVLLFQLLAAAPTAMAVLETSSSQRIHLMRIITVPARNPIVLASAAGVTCALIGWHPPADVLRPFELIGQSAVPLALVALGMSLHGSRPLRNGPDAGQRYTAVALKVLGQPATAFLIGRFALGLEGRQLLAGVVMSALPAAQNIFVYATRYSRGEALARDVIVLSTVVTAVTLPLFGWLLS